MISTCQFKVLTDAISFRHVSMFLRISVQFLLLIWKSTIVSSSPQPRAGSHGIAHFSNHRLPHRLPRPPPNLLWRLCAGIWHRSRRVSFEFRVSWGWILFVGISGIWVRHSSCESQQGRSTTSRCKKGYSRPIHQRCHLPIRSPRNRTPEVLLLLLQSFFLFICRDF